MSRVTMTAACVAALLAPCLSAAPFGPNNLAVLRVGTGAAALSNACTEVFIDEYDVFGNLQQSIALPTATVDTQRRFCLSGTATSEGMLTRSADGSVLVVAGYDAAIGLASVSSAAGIPRVVAVIRQDGSIDTSTAFTDGFTNNNIRGAASDDGSRFWLSGTGTGGGVRYVAALGASTSIQVSTTITNARSVNVFNGQLYASSQSGAFRLSTVGSGLPTTTGQTMTNLPGLPTATTSPYQYLFGDYDGGVVGLDVLYVANDDATGVQKWSLVGGNWVSNGTIGVAADAYRGMTQYGDSLFVTGRAGGVGVIRRIDDTSGYNGALSGSATTLVTASANRVFQGIALSPALGKPPAVTVANVSVIEGNPPGTTTMTFTATLAQAIQDSCDFSVETFDSSPDATATPNVDYTPIAVDVTIPAGQTSATFDVPIIRDTDIEGDEVLVIDVYGEPSACDIFGIKSVFGTIVDDDVAGPPDISINDVSLFEGNGGSTLATLTVSLSAPAPAGGVTVNYATANGTASAALADYTAASGTLSFVAGDASETITVAITGDTFFEADENLFVNLTGAVGGNIADGQGQVTILNDDGQATLAIDSVGIAEGTGAGTTTLVFTVTASQLPAPGETITVDYASSGGSAVSGTDFTAVNGTLTFTNGGALTRTIGVPITRDNIDENDESFTVVLGNASNGLIYLGTGLGTIFDDDTAVVSINSVSQNEGNSGTSNFNFTVSLSVPAATPREFIVYTADVSATAGSDYVGIPPVPGQLVQFPALATAQPVAVTVNGDTTVEPDETFEVRVAPVAGGIEGLPPVLATGIGTIVNDDVAVAVSINDVSVIEGTGAGTTNAVFTVTATAQPAVGAPVTVNYATAGGSATSGTDFTATSGTLTFANGGALTQTISVPITRDNIDENDEGFVVNITATGASVSDGQGAGTIVDDDNPPTPSIANVSVTEGNSGSVAATFTITLSNPSSFALNYQASTANGSAVAPGDYQPIAGSSNNVAFAPLQTTQTISVNVIGELLVEADETFVLELRNGTPTVVASASGTIVNDDSATLSIVGGSVPEGNAGLTPLAFTATLSNPVQAQVQVNYASADATATVVDNDYQAANGTLTFPGSSTTQTLSVNVVGDIEVEPDQTFAVNLSGLIAPAGVTLGAASASGTIVNDDATSFSIASASVTEGTGSNSTLNFTVTLSAPAKDPVSVQYASANGSAVAPTDYTAASGTLTFAGGQTSANIAVTVVGDNLVEPDETLTVTLGNPSGGSIATGSATGTIVNDDFAVLSINDLSLAEGSGGATTPFVFTVSSSNPSSTPITVNFQTGDGSAGAPQDYAAANGTLTIPAQANNAPVTVTVIADNLVEGNETFNVTLSSPQGATLGDGVGVGTILDDDDLIPVPALDSRALALLIALMLAVGIAGIARRR